METCPLDALVTCSNELFGVSSTATNAPLHFSSFSELRDEFFFFKLWSWMAFKNYVPILHQCENMYRQGLYGDLRLQHIEESHTCFQMWLSPMPLFCICAHLVEMVVPVINWTLHYDRENSIVFCVFFPPFVILSINIQMPFAIFCGASKLCFLYFILSTWQRLQTLADSCGVILSFAQVKKGLK